MLPIYAASYLANRLAAHAIRLCNYFVRLTICNPQANYWDVAVFNNGHAVFLPKHGSKSSLAHFVRYVIGVCPEKKMVGIAATPNIAPMKNVQPAGYFPSMHYPAKSMCLRFADILPYKSPVTRAPARRHPEPTPAFRDSLDSFVKSLNDRLAGSHCRVSYKTGIRLGSGGVCAPPVPSSYSAAMG